MRRGRNTRKRWPRLRWDWIRYVATHHGRMEFTDELAISRRRSRVRLSLHLHLSLRLRGDSHHCQLARNVFRASICRRPRTGGRGVRLAPHAEERVEGRHRGSLQPLGYRMAERCCREGDMRMESFVVRIERKSRWAWQSTRVAAPRYHCAPRKRGSHCLLRAE